MQSDYEMFISFSNYVAHFIGEIWGVLGEFNLSRLSDTHMLQSVNWDITGSVNGLLPIRCQAII